MLKNITPKNMELTTNIKKPVRAPGPALKTSISPGRQKPTTMGIAKEAARPRNFPAKNSKTEIGLARYKSSVCLSRSSAMMPPPRVSDRIGIKYTARLVRLAIVALIFVNDTTPDETEQKYAIIRVKSANTRVITITHLLFNLSESSLTAMAFKASVNTKEYLLKAGLTHREICK
jgi:hypothetical protein